MKDLTVSLSELDFPLTALIVKLSSWIQRRLVHTEMSLVLLSTSQ